MEGPTTIDTLKEFENETKPHYPFAIPQGSKTILSNKCTVAELLYNIAHFSEIN